MEHLIEVLNRKMKCGCVLSAWKPLIMRLFLFPLLKSVNVAHTQSNTHGRGVERFGLRDPKIK